MYIQIIKFDSWVPYGLSRSALTPTARNLNIPNFVTAPHAKIFSHHPPDQKFHMDSEEVGQLSRDIFRPMILRYFLSASKRPVD